MGTGRKLDDAFLGILKDWTHLTSQCAEQAVSMILKNSGEYLSTDQQKAVSDFHSLYLGSGDVAESQVAMNREVDDLVDAIQAEMAGNRETICAEAIAEDEQAKKTRLSLSGVQKQLETIIQLETGLKEKLVPVLSSMQFEDAIKQRLQRMTHAWSLSLEIPPESLEDVTAMGEQIGKSFGSSVERKSFYPNVLKRDPPADAVEEMTFFDSLI